MTPALLDGDVIAFRAVAAATDKDGDDILIDSRRAIRGVETMVEQWRRAARASSVVVCLSPRDGGNFRKALDPAYKAHRGDKPDKYWQVVDFIEDTYRTQRYENLEADDVMGILAGHERFKDAVVVTIDKDLRSVPCRYLNPDKDKRPYKIRPVVADHNWMYQTLIGDSTDGYKGCPNIGPVNAERLLNGTGSLAEMWSIVTETFVSKKRSIKDAIHQARLARILRTEDFNEDDMAIRLWHPTKPEWVPLSTMVREESDEPGTL